MHMPMMFITSGITSWDWIHLLFKMYYEWKPWKCRKVSITFQLFAPKKYREFIISGITSWDWMHLLFKMYYEWKPWKHRKVSITFQLFVLKKYRHDFHGLAVNSEFEYIYWLQSVSNGNSCKHRQPFSIDVDNLTWINEILEKMR